MKKILNIDGGGVRVYFPLLILDYIEQKTGKKIIDLFDYFSGVSSSSIVLSGLLTKYSVKELLILFKNLSKVIFYRSYYYIIKSGFGLFNSKYTDNYINEALKYYFGDLKLSDVKKPLTILSYDLQESKSICFDTYNFSNDYKLWEVIRGSTSAPTYYPPYKLDSYLLVDGGIVTNNLSELNYTKSISYFGKEKEFLQLSLGTGCYKPQKPQKSGLLSWINFNSISSNAASSFETIELKNLLLNNLKYFYRLEIDLDNDIMLDDYNSFEQMEQIFNKWLENNKTTLDTICNIITE